MDDLALLPNLLSGGFLSSRNLQQFLYTSPPLVEAILATPEPFRNDTYIDLLREKATDGVCSEDITGCQILFPPPPSAIESGTAKLGVIFYGGALVDPRSYSVLAMGLAETYGLAVTVPVFTNDVAFLGCNGTNRIPLALEAFPYIEKWVLVGHSLGGVGAQFDLWNAIQDGSIDQLGIGGLVLLGSYINPAIGCGVADFSETAVPMAIVAAELDGIINITKFDSGSNLTSANDTLNMVINGGNHGYFGHYNDSLRTPILKQVDGNATIPRRVQVDLSISAIAHVVSRLGLPFADIAETGCGISDSNSGSSFGTHWLVYGIIAGLTWSVYDFF